jgi:hypothetical protein
LKALLLAFTASSSIFLQRVLATNLEEVLGKTGLLSESFNLKVGCAQNALFPHQLCLPSQYSRSVPVFAGRRFGRIRLASFFALLSKNKKRNNGWTAPSILKNLLGGVLLSLIAFSTLYLIYFPATLQAGLPVANALLNGKYTQWGCLFLFAAKLLETVIAFGMGGVGGLFVFSATIGAALGAICPSHPGLFTLVGIAAFTRAVTTAYCSP